MSARRRSALIVAGALASATIAFAGPACAQLILPTTTTTTTTSSTTSTTSTTVAPTTTSSTTTVPGGTSSTTSSTVGGTSTTTTSSTTTTTAATTASSSSGSLSISAPAAVDLQSASIDDGSVSGALGPVQVSDSRGAFADGWTATVAASPFRTGSGSPAETIPASSVYYWSGPATATSGVGTFVPGQATQVLAVSLGSSRPAFSCIALGSCSATWSPRIEIRFPAGVVAGEYEGTVTHSVA